ncbi:MAG TPA: RNA methyltransferase [Anaeromyxobacteraceae bacterium]|nr:RNA methyltransferase [Anaeromyxobacteraceae bacterium]
MDPARVLLVLHRPSSAENLGAVARVMKNFGLTRLLVVEPPAWSGRPRSGRGGPAREDVLSRARVTARRAGDVLSRVELSPDLASALASATWACGTTSRAVEGRAALSPRQLAAEAARRSRRGPVAVVLGEERRGLSDAELELCQAVCTIPTDAGYDSMNLAQAAAVLCYELHLAAGRGVSPERGRPVAREAARRRPTAAPEKALRGRPGEARRGEPVRRATAEALWERLRALLAAAGYLNPQNPDHILAEWRRLLDRAEPTQREVELLLAAARALERALRLRRSQ